MNAAMTTENIALQHDNKQLNALIREYEQTLETLMSACIPYSFGIWTNSISFPFRYVPESCRASILDSQPSLGD
jgi:hypothetical protein